MIRRMYLIHISITLPLRPLPLLHAGLFLSLYVHVCLSFAAFEDVGVDLQRPLVATCGSAVVAGMLALGLDQVGIKAPVYDVSPSGKEEGEEKKEDGEKAGGNISDPRV